MHNVLLLHDFNINLKWLLLYFKLNRISCE